MGRYELFEHTADIGVRAYGNTLEDAFSNSALGLFEVLTNVGTVELKETVEFEVRGTDLEDLLTRFLTEILFFIDTRKLLLAEFDLNINTAENSLSVKARGEVFQEAKHEYKTEIKAVTQHMLEVGENDSDDPDEKYWVQVLLDI